MIEALYDSISFFYIVRCPSKSATHPKYHHVTYTTNAQAGFDYDAKTKEGFARFILPLILDSIFHRLAPKVFAPNGIRLLQARAGNVIYIGSHVYQSSHPTIICTNINTIPPPPTLQDHRYTYTAVRNRKRRDRALQVLLIGTAVTGVGKVALWAAKTAARVILKA